MRQVTGRAVRNALGTAAAIATLALPLALGTLHSASADSAPSVRAAQAPPTAVGLDDDDLPTLPKPPKPKPGDPTGSWVWDREGV
ncbi:hypothetical protein ACGFNV_31985 [Streptomyces sp. NPDC048751]|uniref:hypothetical protein n=1 Tax=Streptomyces sp. NPDC048751 TaxID=3365591 RepID=UPI003711D3E2